MNIEINLKNVCLDLLILRKHVYNCNRFFTAVDHLYVYIHVGVRTCTLYSIFRREYMRRSAPSLLLPLLKEWQENPAGNRQAHGKNLVWFGELERKLAKSSKTTFTYRSSSLLFYGSGTISSYSLDAWVQKEKESR